MFDSQRKTANLWSAGNISIAIGDRYKSTNIDLPTNTYTFKAKYSSTNTGSVTIGFYDENNTIHTYSMTQIDGTVSASYTGIITAIRLYSAAGYSPSASYAADFTEIMLNEGSTALPYEPYGWQHSLRKLGTSTDTITTLPADVYADGNNATVGLVGNMSQTGTPSPSSIIMPQETGDLETSGEHAGQYKIPISSASTTTPVYLGEVQSTRRIKKLVLDGTENWNEGTSNYYIFINVSGRGDGIPNSTALSTHTESGVVTNNNGTALFFKKSVFVYSSLADFKAYLAAQYAAGTPVCVWYVLATETTGIINEPIRKIGNYADTVSGITIPTITGKDTFDVLTTLKPSEVSLNYTGWHDASVGEWDGSEWQ